VLDAIICAARERTECTFHANTIQWIAPLLENTKRTRFYQYYAGSVFTNDVDTCASCVEDRYSDVGFGLDDDAACVVCDPAPVPRMLLMTWLGPPAMNKSFNNKCGVSARGRGGRIKEKRTNAVPT